MIQKEQERIENINQEIQKNPQLINTEYYSQILKGQIVTGMTPFDAKLAGGEFYFKISPDKNVWPNKYDPFHLMWSQSLRSDQSEIQMYFKNNTQFPSKGIVSFLVFVKNGIVQYISEEN